MHDTARRQDFLDAALNLFAEKGYDKTTVNDIIGKLNASKGAFYHYFKSKEDVLEAVAQRHIGAEIAITQKTAEDNGLKAREKLNKIFNEVLTHKAFNMEERQKISRAFTEEGNIKFQRKIAEHKITILQPLYRSIIEQGIREGIVDTFYVEETAEQIIHLLIILNSVLKRLASAKEKSPDNIESIRRKIEAYQVAVERILGAAPGFINLSEVAAVYTEACRKGLQT